MRLLVALSAWAIASSVVDVDAATLTVATDGAAQFSSLHDAIDAASPGDTIRVGPGRYDEVRSFQLPGGVESAYAFVDFDALTILGSSRDSVVIGGAVPLPNPEDLPFGILANAQGNLRLERVTIENANQGVSANGDWVTIDDCRIRGADTGILTFMTGRATITNTLVEDCSQYGMLIAGARGGTGTIIERCQVSRVAFGFGIDIQTPGSRVSDTSIFESGVSLQVSFGADALIERCNASGPSRVHFAIRGGAPVTLVDSNFIGDVTTNVSVSGSLQGWGNVLSGGSFTVLEISGRSVVNLTGSHILNGGLYSVETSAPPPGEARTHDLRGNYWGTTDASQIRAWIFDQEDVPDEPFATVLFEPFAGQPVKNGDRTTFGGMKLRIQQESSGQRRD